MQLLEILKLFSSETWQLYSLFLQLRKLDIIFIFDGLVLDHSDSKGVVGDG